MCDTYGRFCRNFMASFAQYDEVHSKRPSLIFPCLESNVCSAPATNSQGRQRRHERQAVKAVDHPGQGSCHNGWQGYDPRYVCSFLVLSLFLHGSSSPPGMNESTWLGIQALVVTENDPGIATHWGDICFDASRLLWCPWLACPTECYAGELSSKHSCLVFCPRQRSPSQCGCNC